MSLLAMAIDNGHYIWQRTSTGAAVNPETKTTCILQDTTLFEVIVLDGGGIIYIRNIIYGSEQEFGDYWVTGYTRDNEIRVPLDQPLLQLNSDGAFIKNRRSASLSWGSVSYSAITQRASFTRNSAVTEIVYNMDGNTIHIENTSGPVVIEQQDDVSYDATGPAIVWEDEEAPDKAGYEWAGYLEWDTEIYTAPHVFYGWPEGELKTYNRTSDCIRYTSSPAKAYSYSVTGIESLSGVAYIVFGKDGRTVYMRDPVPSLACGTWIIGTLSDNGTTIRFNLPQVLYDYGSSLITIETGLIQKGLQPYGWTYDEMRVNTFNDYQEVIFNIKDNTISLENTWADFIEPATENIYAQGLHAYDPMFNKGVLEANIVYTLESDEPTEKTDAPSSAKENYVYNDGNTSYNAYTITLTETEPSDIYYRIGILTDGDYVYGNWMLYEDVLSFTEEGTYMVESYAIAANKLESDHIWDGFTVSKLVCVEEFMAGKTVSSIRYYNLAGQQMRQPNGMTIMVTTYTDGTTTAEKVVR